MADPKRPLIAVWGCSHDGRLGIGKFNPTTEAPHQSTPTLVPYFVNSLATDEEVVSIHVGGFHTFVRTTKAVFGFGLNDEGQLGTGEKQSSYATPTVISFLTNELEKLVTIACGATHTVVWRTDGIYACGSNKFGNLGLGDHGDPYFNFTKVDLPFLQMSIDHHGEAAGAQPAACERDLRYVVSHISCGTYHTLIALKNVFLSAPPDNVTTTQHEDRGKEQSTEEVHFYPAVVMACGKGDYGELGYNADPWDLLTGNEQRLKRLVSEQAHYVGQGGPADDSAASHSVAMGGSDAFGGGAKKKPPVKFKSIVAKARRAEFFHSTFKKVNIAELDAQAANLGRSASEGEVAKSLRISVKDIAAMHLSSSVTLEWEYNDPTLRRVETLRFGCYYDGTVEGDESSVPTIVPKSLLVSGERRNGAVLGLHAADESMILFIHGAERKTTGGEVEGSAPDNAQGVHQCPLMVVGRGNLGLGDEDAMSFEPSPVPLPLSTCTTSGGPLMTIRTIGGRSTVHILGVNGANEDVVIGYGDNLFGQVGIGSSEDKVVKPCIVVQGGDVLHIPRQASGSGTPIKIGSILQIGCGSRHVVLLFRPQ